MSAMKLTQRGGAMNETEQSFIRQARAHNGFWLFLVHEGRFVEARQVTRPIAIARDAAFVDYEILQAA